MITIQVVIVHITIIQAQVLHQVMTHHHLGHQVIGVAVDLMVAVHQVIGSLLHITKSNLLRL